MTEAEAIEVMTKRWITAWPTLQESVPYTFEGEVYDAAVTWVRVTFLHTERRQATMGPTNGRRFESRGNIIVQLFADIGAGRRMLAQLAGSVRTVYEGRLLGDNSEIVTYAGSTRELGSDGRWLMATVSIPFWYDETV